VPVKRIVSFFTFVLMLAFGTLISLPSAQAARGNAFDRLNLESPPLVIEVGGPGLGDYPYSKIVTYTRKINLKQGQSAYLDYSVEGPIRATLSVEMVDLGIDKGGSKIPVPLNSTKFSLSKIITPILDKTSYIPNGKKQHYRVKITNNVGSLKGVRLGGIKVNLIPAVDPKAQQKVLNQVNAIVVTVGAVQYGFDLTDFNAKSKINAVDHRFIPVHRNGLLGLIDYIPNLPRVIDHGAADWSLVIKNIGEQPLDEFVRWRIVKGFSTPFVDDSKKFKYYYAFESQDHLTIPGQIFRERTRTVIIENTEVTSSLRSYAAPRTRNALPMFGFITTDAQVHTSFGAFAGKTKHFSRTYLIFPWKEVLVLFLLYKGYRRIRRKLKEDKKQRIERELREAEEDALAALSSLSPAKKAPAKKAPAKKAPAKKAPAKKAPAKKAPKK
jgi:hypothetical protein